MPWAVVFKQLAAYSPQMRDIVFIEMMLFVALLLVGYVYVLKKGLFDWGQNARREAEAQARALTLIEGRVPAEQNRKSLSRAA
jgi:NADH-quinone oxidoreductase subunit A